MEFFLRFKEFESGLNFVTVSGLFTLIFFVLMAIAFMLQAYRIRKYRSGESLSVYMIAYATFQSIGSISYGYHIGSFAFFINGFLFIFEALVLYRLYCFKKFALGEKIMIAGMIIATILMYVLPMAGKSSLMIIIMIGSVFTTFSQPYEMIKTGKPGVVDPKLLFAVIIVSAFWLVYAIVAGLALIIAAKTFSILACVIILAIFYFLKYKKCQS